MKSLAGASGFNPKVGWTDSARRPGMALSLILLLAAGLRLPLACLPNFNVDEAYWYYVSRLSFADCMLSKTSDRHPPLYAFLLHTYSNLFNNEFALRLPSLLAALLSIFLIYQIAKTLTRQGRISLLAAFFAAVFFSFWNLDITARMYAIAQALALLSMHFFLRIVVERDDRLLFRLCHIVSSMAALYCNYLNCFIVLSQMFVLLLLDRGSRRKWFSFLCILAMCAPLILLFRAQRQAFLAEGFSFEASLHLNLGMFYTYFLGLIPALKALFHFDLCRSPFLDLSAVLCAMLLVAQMWFLRKVASRYREAATVLNTIFWTYFLSIVVISGVLRCAEIRMRYFFFLFPYLAIILALAMAWIAARWARYLVVACLTTVNLFLFWNYNVDSYLWEYNLKPLADLVRTEGKKDDILCFYAYDQLVLGFDYYFDRSEQPLFRRGDIISVRDIPRKPRQYIIGSLEELAANMDNVKTYSTIWFLINTMQCRDFKSQPQVRAIFSRNTQVLAAYIVHSTQLMYGDETVYLYKLRPQHVRHP